MKRLECLDGLRGVLAVYVMLGHMAPFAAMPAWIGHFLSHGGAAVDVFFILSGLVILRSLDSHRYQARPFLTARVARIFPVFLVMFAAAVAVQPLPAALETLPWIGPDSPARGIWSQGWPGTCFIEILAHLTMTHGLFPDGLLPDVWVRFLGAAWSLSTEWQFYVLALVVGRTRIGHERLAAFFLALAIVGLGWETITPEPWHFSRAFLPNKAHYFALGIASAAWVDRRAMRTFIVTLTVVLALCLSRGYVEKLLPPLLWALCVGGQLYPAQLTLVAVMLRWRLLQWLGAISYPLYLANEPIQKVLGFTLAWVADGNGLVFTVLWLPLATLLPIGVAAWLHRYVETQVPRWLGRQVST